MAARTLTLFLGIIALAFLGLGLWWWSTASHHILTSGKDWHEHPMVPKNAVAVYFSKDAGTSVKTVAVYRQPASKISQDPAELLEFSIQELLQGPTANESDKGLYSEIPPGTKLLGINQTSQGLYINLSDTFSSGGGSNSMEQRLEEVLKTVVTLKLPKPVYLQVNGKLLKVLGGEGVMVNEPLSEDERVTN